MVVLFLTTVSIGANRPHNHYLYFVESGSPMAGIEALDNSIALLSTVVIDASSESELTDFNHKLRGIEAAVDRLKLDVTQRANRLHTQGLSGTATEVLASDPRVPRQEAKREASRADAVDTVPGAAQAFTAGEISGAHLDIIAKRTKSLKPEQRVHLDSGRLLRQAKTMTPDQFDRAAGRVVEKAKNDWVSRFARTRVCSLRSQTSPG